MWPHILLASRTAVLPPTPATVSLVAHCARLHSLVGRKEVQLPGNLGFAHTGPKDPGGSLSVTTATARPTTSSIYEERVMREGESLENQSRAVLFQAAVLTSEVST